MSDKKFGYQAPQLFTILGLLVLASGATFLWTTQKSAPKSPTQGAAIAAPQARPPMGNRPAIVSKPATKTERTAAQKTISSQLQAFAASNWKEAVKFQSAGLRDNFPSPESFGQMIEQTYPAFVRPKKVTYGNALSVNGSIQFEVTLQGQDNSQTRALYMLTKEKGNYRIQSVLGGVVPPPPADSEWT